mmetsp:Transcript_13608/g.34439  ORF Transcript_13608/g.34439 Transcript_13608/m.34439 type:complete len:367 (+) Transcript_13608:32-1132(+)
MTERKSERERSVAPVHTSHEEARARSRFFRYGRCGRRHSCTPPLSSPRSSSSRTMPARRLSVRLRAWLRLLRLENRRGLWCRSVPERLPHLLPAVGQKPWVHDRTPQRREEGQKDHRGIPGRQLRRGVVGLQGLVTLARMRVVVCVPFKLKQDVVCDTCRRVPRVLRLHWLELAGLQLAPLQAVVLQVVHTLEEKHCHCALGQEERHGQRTRRSCEAQGHSCGDQKVCRNLAVPPRQTLPLQPGRLDAASRQELALHHTRQELVETLPIARGRWILVCGHVLVVPQGVLNIEVAVASGAQQQAPERSLQAAGFVAELVPHYDPDDPGDDAHADAQASKLQAGQAAKVGQPSPVAKADQDPRCYQQG